MTPERVVKTYGDLKEVWFTFKAGDVLPTHVHNEKGSHVTFIKSGSFVVDTSAGSYEVNTGAHIDIPANVSHQFTAKTDGIVINIPKYYA